MCVGYKTVTILNCIGSPTCGITVTRYDTWGGSPVELNDNGVIVQGKAFTLRGWNGPSGTPPFYDLTLDNESVDTAKIITYFCIHPVCLRLKKIDCKRGTHSVSP